MKNRGYTLLELLGVIVILALLTTLVFPSILNSIKESSDDADKLSMNLIDNAVDLYIENHINEFIKFNGNRYVIEINELLEDGNLPSNIKISDVDNIVDKCIEVTYQNGFNYELKEKGNCKRLILFDSVCKLASESTVTGVNAGAKYNCKVDPNKDAYTFYVLTTPAATDTTINLIMNQNINSDGTPAGMDAVTQDTNANKYSLVVWNANGSNTDGPVDAMNFLYNATKDWINIAPLNYTYNDKIIQGPTKENTSYTSFVSSNGILTITSLSGDKVTIGTSDEPLRTRMVMYASDPTITEVTSETNAPYLYDNLKTYHTLSSDADDSERAWFVTNLGLALSGYVSGVSYGVRPVINFPITDLEGVLDE